MFLLAAALLASMPACGGASSPSPSPFKGAPPATAAASASASAVAAPPNAAPPLREAPHPASVCSIPLTIELYPPKLDRKAPGPSRENLRAWVDLLANPALRGRRGGSVENKHIASMLAHEFKALGLSGPPSDGEMCRAFELRGVSDQNVVAHFRSISSKYHREDAPVIVIGAHYDAQGVDAAGSVYPGADDNASGVAALMEIARVVGERAPGSAVESDIVFIAFGAEELGTLGSRAFVKAPTVPLDRVSLMINLDMVGRQFLEGSPLRRLFGGVDNALGYVVSKRSEVATEARVRRAARATGTRLMGIPQSILVDFGFLADSVMFSDHTPTLFLSSSMHGDYHRPTDTSDKIDAGQIERAARLVLEIIGAGPRPAAPPGGGDE